MTPSTEIRGRVLKFPLPADARRAQAACRVPAGTLARLVSASLGFHITWIEDVGAACDRPLLRSLRRRLARVAAAESAGTVRNERIVAEARCERWVRSQLSAEHAAFGTRAVRYGLPRDRLTVLLQFGDEHLERYVAGRLRACGLDPRRMLGSRTVGIEVARMFRAHTDRLAIELITGGLLRESDWCGEADFPRMSPAGVAEYDRHVARLMNGTDTHAGIRHVIDWAVRSLRDGAWLAHAAVPAVRGWAPRQLSLFPSESAHSA